MVCDKGRDIVPGAQPSRGGAGPVDPEGAHLLDG